MSTVIIQNNQIKLNSSLNEYSFGKTNYYTLLSEKGLMFNNDTFTPWSFENINTFKEEGSEEELVFYCGKNLLSKNAKTLLDFFNENSEELFDAVFDVVKAMTNAAENNIKLPIVGAGGIIVDTNSSNVLFLPEEAFKNSTNLLPEEQFFNQNSGWINLSLSKKPAICFERAVIVYKLLTGNFPYTSTNETERDNDILNENFLPLELCIEKIDESFANDINKALKLNSTAVVIPGRNKRNTEQRELKVNCKFDFDKLSESWNIKKSSNSKDEELEKKAATFIKNKNKKINTKRNLKAYKVIIVTIICFVVAGIILAISSVNTQNNKYTQEGLSSTETIQCFFDCFNNRSLELMNKISNGKAPDKYVEFATQIDLNEKQISSFTRKKLYATPEVWLNGIKLNKENYDKLKLFGITNLNIDGEQKDLNVHVSMVKDDPTPITRENNKVLNNNDKITHKVNYYFIMTNPENAEI